MSHLEWFPTYAERFLQSRRVKAMTLEEVGAFQMLLCEQWHGGPIPDNDRIIEGICKQNLSIAKAVLKECFELMDDGWINPELKAIWETQKDRHRKKVESGRRGGKQSPSKPKAPLKRNPTEEEEETTMGGRKHPLPDSWTPTESHQKKAMEEGVELVREAEKFRNNALANNRKLVRWNQGFTNWLINAGEYRRKDGRPPATQVSDPLRQRL